ncbi:hypothetical protein DRN93_02735 [archaeon]|nr:MAG: hypothetical protein DRN08_05245 [Thermoplasmata archaeon]RLG68479.1 MAG: hypothetical protein DRN93_02735 [archaeon]HDN18165.1 hypothetical protein [Candidatus Bathyarchaeota archaeon]
MVRVRVSALNSMKVEGKEGVRIEFVSLMPDDKVSISAVGMDDTMIAQSMVQNVMTGLRQAGLLPTLGKPRLILFLTNDEYKRLGSPQINDIMELEFEESMIVLRKI